MMNSGIEMNSEIATALAFGIRTDTLVLPVHSMQSICEPFLGLVLG